MEHRSSSLVTQATAHNQYRTSKKSQKQKGFWYWLIIFPIKWVMILTVGLVVIMLGLTFMMLVASFALIAFIPWAVVCAIRHKPLVPDSISRSKD